MGLDMYVKAKIYVGLSNMENLRDGIVTLQKATAPLGMLRELSYEFLYFRKANWLHKWFVDNVQEGEDDCGEYEIDVDTLEKVLAVIQEVLDDHSLAESLLPTQSGFFFGDTRMDESYFEELKTSYDYISAEVAKYHKFKKGFGKDIYVYLTYQSSW